MNNCRDYEPQSIPDARSVRDTGFDTVCALSGGRMEDQYLAVVKKHTEGKPGKRGGQPRGTRDWLAYDFRFRRALSRRSGAEGAEASVVGGTDGIARGGDA